MAFPVLAVASLLATIGGAVMQQQAQQSAARRQQRAIQESVQRQSEFQRQAEQAAMKKATEFTPEDRAQQQQQIEQQLTTEMLEPVQRFSSENSAPAVQGDVSDDYTVARAESQANQMKNAEVLARLFGRIGSAQQLRRNETLGLMETGQEIDRLNSFSRGSQAADQIGINAAGVPDGQAMLGGTIAQGLGSVGLSQSIGDLFSTGTQASGGRWAGTLGTTTRGMRPTTPNFKLG